MIIRVKNHQIPPTIRVEAALGFKSDLWHKPHDNNHPQRDYIQMREAKIYTLGWLSKWLMAFLASLFSHYKHTKLMLSKSSFNSKNTTEKSVLDTVFKNGECTKNWLDGVYEIVFSNARPPAVARFARKWTKNRKISIFFSMRLFSVILKHCED